MGKVHVRNMIQLGNEVASMDNKENADASKSYLAKEVDYATVIADGYDVCVVSLPDTMLFDHTKRIMEAGFKRILLEKPGSTNSDDLQKLVNMAEEKDIPMFINYQRSFDERINALYQKIKQKVSEGYQLVYALSSSSDKEVPPQHFP